MDALIGTGGKGPRFHVEGLTGKGGSANLGGFCLSQRSLFFWLRQIPRPACSEGVVVGALHGDPCLMGHVEHILPFSSLCLLPLQLLTMKLDLSLRNSEGSKWGGYVV